MYISRDSGGTWSYDDDHKDLFFITYDDRNLPPEIRITKPDKALYVNDKKILPWFSPFIVGNINIDVKASDPEEKISYIEFYIDDEFRTYDTDPPYCWTWDNRTPFRFRHTIKVIAYDEIGKSGRDEISVWRFL